MKKCRQDEADKFEKKSKLPEIGTDRQKPAENTLIENEAHYRALFEYSPVSLWEEDFSDVKKHIDGLRASGVSDFRAFFDEHPEEVSRLISEAKIIRVNQATFDLFKAGSMDDLSRGLNVIFSEESIDIFKEALIAFADGDTHLQRETVLKSLADDNLCTIVRFSLVPGHIDTWEQVILSFSDITERKQAEMDLQQSEEKYRSIFENSPEGIFQSTPDARFISVNPALAHMYGYDSPDEMMAAIVDIGSQLYVYAEERVRYKNILEKSGTILNFETQSPKKNGEVMWVSLNAREKRNADGDIKCFDGFVEDITSRKMAEIDLEKTAEKLRNSLMNTIQALSVTVEIRDPYTSGHQKRVSKLTRAIAQGMSLPNDTVDNICMASIIHDIGKLSLPAEILSKPGKLSDIEFSLIKCHSQSGYDIIKDIGLPYPIADMVLQHHEKMDGSGYPRGLKNEQILLESKIITVADVVEAMASHRPYRPALGIDTALEEIAKYKGILYDPAVVDMCLELFREKGFTFED